MPVNPLPPQAYTKETLQKAYAWLLTQNASVKEIAQDQNILVSLYLKAQRNGDASLEAPSIQNFKQELKSLAHLMGDFQTAPQAQSQPQSQSMHSTPATVHNTAQVTLTQPTSQIHPKQSDLNFDPKTLSAIHDVRETLNLSSDTEALRALVALGIKHFRKAQL